ncbi:MAG: MIP/aquaporin family protein [Chloroflexota bacterium]
METRKYLAELVGTFLFLTIGYSSVAALGVADVPNLLVVPFAFGFGLLAAIFAVGHISGGHFNPAVTVAAVLDKRIETTDAIGYILAQVIGAIAAAVIVFVVVGQSAVAAGVTKPGPGVTDIGALILEIVMTAGFVLVILVSTKRAAGLAPLAIPLTLVAIHFASATLSGASVNPARSIGSALIGADLSALWIYLVGPIVGALGGWAIYRVLDDVEEEVVA